MRLRKKPWTDKELSTNDLLIESPERYKGKWNEFFGNQNPVHLEIGCGKGQFITKMSKLNTDINYIAAEKQIVVMATAMRKARESGALKNLAFIKADAAELEKYFDEGEISRIYINFCDPWHNKKKWAKRRLTNRSFLSIYEKIFGGKGEIFFKTDNKKLFEFSLNEISQKGWIMKNISLDLHKSGFEENVTTEYEDRFSSLGMPIYRLEGYYASKQ